MSLWRPWWRFTEIVIGMVLWRSWRLSCSMVSVGVGGVSGEMRGWREERNKHYPQNYLPSNWSIGVIPHSDDTHFNPLWYFPHLFTAHTCVISKSLLRLLHFALLGLHLHPLRNYTKCSRWFNNHILQMSPCSQYSSTVSTEWRGWSH